MANYRRAHVPGGTFFFTVVTHQRREILTNPGARSCLRTALREVAARRPFQIDAIVLLPDHLHTVWTLPPDDMDFPTRWRQIKAIFTRAYISEDNAEAAVSAGRARQGDRGIWQRRYYEHTVRDEADLKRCIDYLHLNPVKHQLVPRVGEWPWSTFHRYVQLGDYAPEWGGSQELFGDEWDQFE